jgi:hypothetical protein
MVTTLGIVVLSIIGAAVLGVYFFLSWTSTGVKMMNRRRIYMYSTKEKDE